MAKVTYFEKKDNQLIFTGQYMEAYIPHNLFKKNLNEFMGDKVNLMGIFNFRLGNKNGDIDDKSELFTFNFPSMMTSKPNSIETKEMEIFPDSGITKYVVLKYFNGGEVMTSLKIVKGIENVDKFINLLLSASLPNTIKYEDLLVIFLKNLEINGETAGSPAALFSMVVSELSRYKKDSSIPFRRIIGKGKAGQYDYQLANVRTVCANNSTFSAMTFEDIDTMTVYSINKKRYNKKENYSPIEKIIKV